MVEVFMCKDCPLCEDYEYRLKVMEKGFPLQTEYCSCDKVGTYFYNGGYCEDAWEFEETTRKRKKYNNTNKRRKEFHKNKRKKELIKNKNGKIDLWLSDNEKYIMYPKNSKHKKALKKRSNKIIRRNNRDCLNHSDYKKFLDYKWLLY